MAVNYTGVAGLVVQTKQLLKYDISNISSRPFSNIITAHSSQAHVVYIDCVQMCHSDSVCTALMQDKLLDVKHRQNARFVHKLVMFRYYHTHRFLQNQLC